MTHAGTLSKMGTEPLTTSVEPNPTFTQLVKILFAFHGPLPRHNSPLLFPIISQMHPVYNFRLYFPKVKLSLCLTKHHAMKTYGGVEA